MKQTLVNIFSLSGFKIFCHLIFSLFPFFYIFTINYVIIVNNYIANYINIDLALLMTLMVLFFIKHMIVRISNSITSDNLISFWMIPNFLYTVIIFALFMIIVKQELIYITGVDPVALMSGIKYLDFFDKLFWGKTEFNNNITYIGAVLKIWITGFFLLYNPFSSNKLELNIAKDIDVKSISLFLICLLFVILGVSIYESLIDVSVKNIMSTNFYFFKQMLTLSIFSLVMQNWHQLNSDDNKNVYFITEMLLLYFIAISIQTLFYTFIYDVYFLETILIILAVACRDKFNLKNTKEFNSIFWFLMAYQLGFYIWNYDLIDKDIFEKILAISTASIIYFYKDTIIAFYEEYIGVSTTIDLEKYIVRKNFYKIFKDLIIDDDNIEITYDKNKKKFVLNNTIDIFVSSQNSMLLKIYDFEFFFDNYKKNTDLFCGLLKESMIKKPYPPKLSMKIKGIIRNNNIVIDDPIIEKKTTIKKSNKK